MNLGKHYYDVRVINLLRRLKWYHQRGKRGYADCDVWNLDVYLATWMPQAIEQLKQTSHGHATVFCNEDIDWTTHEGCTGEQRQNEAFDRIKEGFAAVLEIYHSYKMPSEIPEIYERFEEGMQAFGKYFMSLND